MKINLVEEKRLPQRETIAEVSFSAPEDLKKIQDLAVSLEKLCLAEGGIGISAVQAGISQNLFLVLEHGKGVCYINCSYEPVNDEKFVHIEGCLSLRYGDNELKMYRVERYTHVQVNGYVLRGDVIEKLENFIVHDFSAAVFQHEIDHSSAILISDIGTLIPRKYL